MSVVTPTITSDGEAMDPTCEVLAIDILREVNRIPRAELTLLDGDVAQRKFAVSDSGFFDPGRTIEIKLRDESAPDSEPTVFAGLVVGHSVEVENLRSVLTVVMKDAAVKLTRVPKTAAFFDLRDDEVIRQLVEGQGLAAGDLAETAAAHKALVQYGCTDWDYILARAEANGLLVCVTDGTVSLGKIELAGDAKRSFDHGIDEIFAVEIEAGGERQLDEVSGVNWAIAEQRMSDPVTGQAPALTPGDLDGGQLASALGGVGRVLTGPSLAPTEELQAWADATLARSRLSLVRGRIRVPGCADLALLDVIELKGIGKHFDGQALVTGWRHRVTDQGWSTDIRFGLAADGFAARPEVAAPRAAGLLPPVGGLQIGVVVGQEDPEQEFRVRVRLAAPGEPPPELWARLATLDAGKGRGFVFRPDPGDEVVLGFFNDDPRQPVILGALFSSAHTPPEVFAAPTDQNPLKGLVTRNGSQIVLDDKDAGKGAVTIATAKGGKVLLDDAAETITVSDPAGNVVTLDKDGIHIQSAKDLILEASGKVTIKGSAVDVQ